MLIWDDAVPEEGTSPAEDISSRVYQLTGNPCRILYYTTAEFEALPDRAADLHSTVSTEGIDLLAPITR